MRGPERAQPLSFSQIALFTEYVCAHTRRPPRSLGREALRGGSAGSILDDFRHAFRPTAEAASRNFNGEPGIKRSSLDLSNAPCFDRRGGNNGQPKSRVKGSDFRRRREFLCLLACLLCSTRNFYACSLACFALLESSMPVCLHRFTFNGQPVLKSWRFESQIASQGFGFPAPARILSMLACLLAFCSTRKFYACLLACLLY